jgi:hypothetical protein
MLQLLMMVENNLFYLYPFEGIDFVAQLGSLLPVGEFKQNQSVGGAKVGGGFVQSQTGADITAILGEQGLETGGVAGPVSYMDGMQDV